VAKSSDQVIDALAADGWTLARTSGSHRQYKHPVKKGVVTVPHPRKDIKIGTLKSIEKQAGIKIP
jgi:predicted RNA binding protein YcfA (HicA-like mRNA interferase family)